MKLHIERLELDLHGGIDAAVAQEAVQRLGPALADALAEASGAAQRASAGGRSLRLAAQPDAATLAQLLARRIAPQLAVHLPPRRSAPHAPRRAAPLGALPGGPMPTPTPTKRET